MENAHEAVSDRLSEFRASDEGWQVLQDWKLAQAKRLNFHLVRRDGALPDAIASSLRQRDEPMMTWRPGASLTLPPVGLNGTLVLYHVSALSPDEQNCLREWLDRAGACVWVISTTVESLLPSIEAGQFLDTLYYRLNTVCVDATDEAPLF
jgi:hypothetical protein